MSIGFNITKKQLQGRTRERRRIHEQGVARRAIAASIRNDIVPEMTLESRPIKLLKRAKKRARKTSPDQLERVMKSIASSGQCAPIIISADGTIINGHIVVEALLALDATDVWCAVIDHLDVDEVNLLHVALNRIAELGEWDIDALGPLLIELDEIGFDLSDTGFTLPELDILMQPTENPEAENEEEIPEPADNPVSQLGDLWELGKHRLLCGDSTLQASYELLLEEELASCVFTDCPWNIPIEGFVSGLGKKKHKDFKMGAGRAGLGGVDKGD